MYKPNDNTSELAAHELSVATDGDNICTKVKRGKFNFSTFTINAYQSIEYLLNKIDSADTPSDFEDQNIVLIDKLQDYHDREVGDFSVAPDAPVTGGTSPTYVAPSITNNITAPTATTQTYEVGDIVTMAGTFTLNQGQMLESWNGNALQNVRSGDISSSSVLATELFKTYYAGGGTKYTALNDSVSATVSPGTVGTLNFSDVEIGYGTVGFSPQNIIDVGPIPVDSNGNPIPSETYTGEVINGSQIIEFYGVTPIYHGVTTASTKLLMNYVSKDYYFTLGAESGGNRHIIEIADDEETYKGAPTFFDTATNTDITTEFTTSSFVKVLDTAVSVNYTRYTRSGALATSGTSIKVTFPKALFEL